MKRGAWAHADMGVQSSIKARSGSRSLCFHPMHACGDSHGANRRLCRCTGWTPRAALLLPHVLHLCALSCFGACRRLFHGRPASCCLWPPVSSGTSTRTRWVGGWLGGRRRRGWRRRPVGWTRSPQDDAVLNALGSDTCGVCTHGPLERDWPHMGHCLPCPCLPPSLLYPPSLPQASKHFGACLYLCRPPPPPLTHPPRPFPGALGSPSLPCP